MVYHTRAPPLRGNSGNHEHQTRAWSVWGTKTSHAHGRSGHVSKKTNQKVVAVTEWNGSLSSVRSHFEMSQVSMVFGVLNKLERINNDVLDITPYLIFKLKNF